MDTNKDIKPISPLVKWAGGKRRIAQNICSKIDFDYNRYFEPFLGGGAVLLTLQPKNAVSLCLSEIIYKDTHFQPLDQISKVKDV